MTGSDSFYFMFSVGNVVLLVLGCLPAVVSCILNARCYIIVE